MLKFLKVGMILRYWPLKLKTTSYHIEKYILHRKHFMFIEKKYCVVSLVQGMYVYGGSMSLRKTTKTWNIPPLSVRNKMGQYKKHLTQGLPLLTGLIAADRAGLLLILFSPPIHPNIDSVFILYLVGWDCAYLLGKVAKVSFSMRR